MKIPPGLKEQEVIDVIETISKRLAYKFIFGYHTPEDMKQQASIAAWESLEKWDGKRPLENFLYVCAHHALFNFKRKHYHRPDKPCLTCPLYDLSLPSQCQEFNNKQECELYSAWDARNSVKKNIVQPTDISNITDENEENMSLPDTVGSVEEQEIWNLIDKHLDVKLRSDYIKIKNGIKVPKPRRLKVESAILEIMREYHDDWP